MPPARGSRALETRAAAAAARGKRGRTEKFAAALLGLQDDRRCVARRVWKASGGAAPPRTAATLSTGTGTNRMSTADRSDARSVILRLRRYRDRIDEFTTGDGGHPASGAPAVAAAQRRLVSLKHDLDQDAHECGIASKRARQTNCEQRFLWPALREAAGAMTEHSGPRPLDALAKAELRAARACILAYLEQLEGLYPTL